jgi:enoyl-CoA hydratase
LLADYLSAQEALSCGYVYDVHAQDELDQAAHALAQRLIALSPVTQKAVKESLRRIVIEQRLDDEDLIEEVYGSALFRDAVAAFTAGSSK